MVKKFGLCLLSMLICLPGTGLAATGSQTSTSNVTVSPTQGQSTVSSDASTMQVQGAALSDATGPTLVSSTMSPSQAQVGDTVTITAKVTDDLSTVNEVDAYLSMNYSSQYVQLSYDSTTDTWSGTYKVEATDPDGTYTLDFDMYDNDENYSYGTSDQTLKINNPNADVQGPVLESVDIPQSVNAQEQFTINAKVTDSAGVDSVEAYLSSPSGPGDYVTLTYDSTKDVWTGSYTFGKYAAAGDWTIEFSMTDKSGNHAYDSSTKVTVVNPNADTTAPVIGDVSVDQTTVKAGGTLTVTANLSDDSSGIEYASANLNGPSGYGFGNQLVLDSTTGLYKAQIPIPSTIQPGTYTVWIYTTDVANNSDYQTTKVTVDVQNDGDFTAPTVNSFTASATTAKPGDVVSFTANVTDDKSTVSTVSVDAVSPNGPSHTAQLTYDSSKDQWAGNYTVGANDQPGTWTFTVRTQDSVGNSGMYNKGSITIDNPNADYTAPFINSVDVSPATVKVGETLTIKVKATDAQSGVSSVIANLHPQAGYTSRSVPLAYDSTSDLWTGSYTVDAHDPSGTWSVTANATDKAGNNGYYWSSKSVTFDNPQYDSVPPVVDSVDISPATSVTPGQDVVITVKAHDDNSGIQSMSGYVTPPSNGSTQYVDFVYDSKTDNWVGRYTVEQNAEPGTWTVNEIELWDKFSNHASATPGKTFTVDNPNADFTAPTLDNVSVSTQTANVGDTIKIKVKAHDDKSGINYVSGTLQGPSYQYNYLNFTYNKNTDEWVATSFVGVYAKSGDYNLQINMSDNAGNYYSGQNLAKVTYNNPDADSTPPVISNVQLSTSAVGVGERATVTADVTDDKSGIGYVDISFSNSDASQHGSKSIDMRYDSKTKKWVGNFDVLDTTPPGTWTFNITARDNADNFTFGNNTNQTITVTNPNGDYTGPTINGITASSSDVNAGDQVTLTADVTDPSGVASVTAYSSDLELVFTKDKTTGKWVATTTIPKNIADGKQITISNLSAEDTKGNYSSSWLYSDLITVHNPTGDSTPPTVGDVQISQTDAKPGDTVQIKAKVTDTQSDVKSVTGFLGWGNFIDFSYDAASGYWTANYTVGQYASPGSLQLHLDFTDANDNSDSLATGKSVNIVNPDADMNDPIIDSLQITPSTANVGDVVTFKANVTDSESGVKSVSVDIGSMYGGTYVPLTYDAAQKAYIGTYKIKSTDPSGKWQVNLRASDFYDNNASYYGLFTVNNDNGDITSPYVDSVKLSSSSATVGDTINFETNLIDDQSGVKSANVTLMTEQTYDSGVTIPLTYDAVKGKWVGTYTVPSYATSGNHPVRIHGEDNAGNQFDEVMFDYNLYIDNDHPDNDSPVIGDTNVTPDQAAAGDTVQLDVNVSDAGSDVASVTADVYGNDSAYYYGIDPSKSINLVKGQTQNTWSGSYTVQSSDQAGDYSFNIIAKDNAGNVSYQDGTAKFTIVVKSPKYGDATWYYDNKNYFNAVYYAGVAIAEGDTRTEVQNLMNTAAQALLDAAAGMNNGDAQAAYQLLADTRGVPTDIKAAAKAKLTVTSPSYDDAVFYNDNHNYFNAVFFASKAIADGDTRAQDLMNSAAQSLFDAAASMNSADAQDAYQLLKDKPGVPSEIATAAAGKIAQVVKSPHYDDAAFYNDNKNYFNAVFYASQAIADGDTRAQDLMNSAAQSLFDAAASMNSADAQDAYQLLKDKPGVPSEIATAAAGKIAQVVKSPHYDEAAFYNDNKNYFNAVFYASQAIADGDTRAQDLMNSAAQSLFDAAASMNSADAQDAYQLLKDKPGVPSEIATAAAGKIAQVVKSPHYDEAAFYNDNKNYFNAVFYASQAIADGDTRAQDLMNSAAQSLFDAAASMNSADAQDAYQLLKDKPGVPSEIATAAAGKIAQVVKSPKYDEAAYYNDNKNYYNAVSFASQAIADGDARAQDLMNSAAQSLFDAAASMNYVDAQNAYDLLAKTTGVPSDLAAAANEKLAK